MLQVPYNLKMLQKPESVRTLSLAPDLKVFASPCQAPVGHLLSGGRSFHLIIAVAISWHRLGVKGALSSRPRLVICMVTCSGILSLSPGFMEVA